MINNENIKDVETAVVIIPTIGKDSLAGAIKSVFYQNIHLNPTHPLNEPKIRISVVIDGYQYKDNAFKIIKDIDLPMLIKASNNMIGLNVVCLSENVGEKGFYGHRIYAGFSHLVNQDVVFFLDEDNWYGPNHVINALTLLNENKELSFVYSLRKIHQNNILLCFDNCESLGKWPIWNTIDMPNKEYLIDTSAYAFRRDFLKNVSSLWHNGYGADRIFLRGIRNHFGDKIYDCTGEYTLNYALGSTKTSANPNYFLEGNKETGNKCYNVATDSFPWNKNANNYGAGVVK